MNKLVKFFLITILFCGCLSLSACSNLLASNSVNSNIVQRGPISSVFSNIKYVSLVTAKPLQFYCHKHRWPKTGELNQMLLQDASLNNRIQNLTVTRRRRNSMDMNFQFTQPSAANVNTDQIPTIFVTILKRPSKVECKKQQFDLKHIKISMRVKK